MERYILCPGSFLLEKETPQELLLGSTSYSLHGTKLAHLVERLLRQGVDFSNPEHKQIAETELAIVEPDETKRSGFLEESERMIGYTKEALDRIGLSFNDTNNIFLVENRLWSTGNAWSGKADITVLNSTKKILCVVDHKSGWLRVQDAEENHQIRANVALASNTYIPIADVKNWYAYGIIVQPNLGSIHRNIAVFSGAEITHLIGQYNAIVHKITAPGWVRPFNVSPKACHYCPARRNCDAIQDLYRKVALLEVKPATHQEALDLVAVCKLVTKDYEDGARAALDKDPNSVPGWKLVPGNKVVKVKNAALAFTTIRDFVKPEEYLGCCTVGLGKLTDVFSKNAGLPKTKGKEALMARIEPHTETKQNQPSIKRADLTPTEEEAE